MDLACWWYPFLFGSGITILLARLWRRMLAELEASEHEEWRRWVRDEWIRKDHVRREHGGS